MSCIQIKSNQEKLKKYLRLTPKLNIYSRNTLLVKKWLKKGYYGNKGLGLARDFGEHI